MFKHPKKMEVNINLLNRVNNTYKMMLKDFIKQHLPSFWTGLQFLKNKIKHKNN
jgi:hypothetical protein